jgi:hypothetical protein
VAKIAPKVDEYHRAAAARLPARVLLLLTACSDPAIGVRPRPSLDTGLEVSTGLVATTGDTGTLEASPTGETGSVALPTADTGAPPGPCPDEMVFVELACIDRYEAHLDGVSPFEIPAGGLAVSEEGEIPQGYISQLVAADAGAEAGKRLCSIDEWMRACGGPEGTIYPYGDSYDPGACNDTRATHPVVDVFGAATTWSDAQLNDPRLNQLPDSLAPAGANPGCVSAEGVFDLHGNLHEWVDDPNGTFKGGFYVDAVLNGPGCTYTTTAHSAGYRDYSTGFRCCRDPEPE